MKTFYGWLEENERPAWDCTPREELMKLAWDGAMPELDHLRADNEHLRTANKSLTSELDQLRAENEIRKEAIDQLRVQLAGCGVAAMCNTVESMEQQKVVEGDYGWSQSYQDVVTAVGREIELRAENERMREAIEAHISAFHPDSIFKKEIAELRTRAFSPAPQFEEVTVTRWLHKHKINLYSEIEPIHNMEDWIVLSGTTQRPIPVKVKKRVELGVAYKDLCARAWEDTKGTVPSSAKLFAEWEE